MNPVPKAISIFLLLLSTSVGAAPAAIRGECQDGVLPSGALSRICIPSSGWNGELVIWAHGYKPFNAPLEIDEARLSDGSRLQDLVQQLGFAFATTSYRTNGLAILTGADDIRELVATFPGVFGQRPERIYLTGGSEGGIITTLLIERSPELFDGGFSACGPIGSFRKQMNSIGDFRVLFDYFFPGVLPGSAVDIPEEVIANWNTRYVPAIHAALLSNPDAAAQLIRTSGAAIELGEPSTVLNTTLGLLWYNVFGTNDAIAKLGGNPYSNRTRFYIGSNNDLRLNRQVQRFDADPAALEELSRYETSGQLTRPHVTLHTTGDEIIPFWHQLLYLTKVRTSGEGRHTALPVLRYGHCAFTPEEVLGAFGLLVTQVRGGALGVPAAAAPLPLPLRR